MNITCDIIKDLLPLYAEDMVSNDSKKLVDDHLCHCDRCRKELAELVTPPKVPLDVEPASLKRVENTIRRRKILAVMTAVFLVATLVLGVSLFLDAKVFLTADQAVVSAQRTEDGGVVIHYSNLVTGTGSVAWEDNNWGVIASTRMGKLLRPGTQEDGFTKYYGPEFQMEGTEEKNLWYCNAKTGIGETLLWDAGKDYDGAPLAQVNYHLAYYFAGVLALGALLLLLSRVLKGKWQGELCFRFGALAACNGVSILIVSAGQFMEVWGEFTECFQKGLTLTVPMVLSVLFVRQILLLRKQDRG